ncbi:MAG: histidine--tRNA ligase, partial [Clostridiales bacterium]|nr:histidine--tRNA ligase [Clostridiales bacterium]
GCPTCRAEYNKALREFLAKNKDKVCGDCKRRAEVNPLRALDCKVPSCREIYKNAPKISDYLCDDCKAHHAAVIKGLDAVGIKYEQDDKLVRGLDYYTRTVFEFNDGGLALMGGGRYDTLCENLGGKPTPCVGFGCGIERLLAAADARGIAFDAPRPDVFVAAQCDAVRGECARIVRALRQGGISAETDLMGKSLKAQFKYADRQGYKYVITLGESELSSGVYGMKCMQDGQTTEIHRDDVVGDVGRILWQK